MGWAPAKLIGCEDDFACQTGSLNASETSHTNKSIFS